MRESGALFGGLEGQIGDYKILQQQSSIHHSVDRESSYYYAPGGGVLDADLVRPMLQLGRDVIDEHTVMGGWLE